MILNSACKSITLIKRLANAKIFKSYDMAFLWTAFLITFTCLFAL